MLTLILTLAACDADKADDTAGDTAPADTDTDSDTDTDTDSDTDTDTDTDTDSDTDTDTGVDGDPATFTFVLDGAAAADTLQLDWLTGDFTAGAVLASAPIVGTTATLTLAVPTMSELVESPDDPGLYYGFALPYLFADAGGDATHADELIEGAGRVWPLFLAGDIPLAYAALGFHSGWNAIELGEGEIPSSFDITAVPVPTNLHPVLDASLSGASAIDADNLRLTLVSSLAIDGGDVGTRIYDEAFDPSGFTLAVSGAPPDDHVNPIDGTGLDGAIEVPVAYVDADGDLTPTDAEYVGPVCAGGEVAALFWIAQPTTVQGALSLAAGGLNAGWSPIKTDPKEDFVFLTDAEATALVVAGGCSLE
jgi:hypothetical protein